MMDTTTICRTPARDPASCRFLAAVVKNSVAAPCSADGPVAASTTDSTRSSAAARPSLVITSTPCEREIATTSCPSPSSTSTTCRPTRPVAPATAILAMVFLPQILSCHPSDTRRRENVTGGLACVGALGGGRRGRAVRGDADGRGVRVDDQDVAAGVPPQFLAGAGVHQRGQAAMRRRTQHDGGRPDAGGVLRDQPPGA